jgi:hypothetical protein
MRGMFVQADVPTLGAVRAIRAAGRANDLVLASFDGTPETLDCLRKGEILVAGMQQPGLMGRRAAEALVAHLQGKKVDREIFVPILIVTGQSLDEQLPAIREHVFASSASRASDSWSAQSCADRAAEVTAGTWRFPSSSAADTPRSRS